MNGHCITLWIFVCLSILLLKIKSLGIFQNMKLVAITPSAVEETF